MTGDRLPFMAKRLLLISTSKIYGSAYFDYCEPEVRDFLGPAIRRVLFVPYALQDRDAYTAMARERFERMGYGIDSVHEGDPISAVENAEAIYIGGGNTFRLLAAMYEAGIVKPIRRRVEGGVPYIGSSAGSNVACVTMKTTNDMPIVYPPSFDGLNLVPFNINPHYLDTDPSSTHMGETREQRIREFHEMNDNPVIGLREGAMLRIEGPEVSLRGVRGARLFRKGEEPEEFAPGARLDFLLASSKN
jgi:dipeptidase E